MTPPDGAEAEARAICDADCELADDKPLSIACHCACRAALRVRATERDEARANVDGSEFLRGMAQAEVKVLRQERDRLAERVTEAEAGLRAAYGYIMFHPDCEVCEQSREIQDSSDATCEPHNREKNALWDTMKTALQAGARGAKG